MNETLSFHDKYRLYEASVQNPHGDIEFIENEFQKIFRRKPLTLREDFAGTAYLACEWTKSHPKRISYGIDLDPTPARYGHEVHYQNLSKEEQTRVHQIEGNVLDHYEFSTEVIVALNFSYFIFKERSLLSNYFKAIYRALESTGIFVLDLFGGTDAYSPSVEESEHDGHIYYWDCDHFNPLTNECLFHIHFKDLKTETVYEKVFTYDWRLWSTAELKDILLEVGFCEVKTYWEGDDEEGSGNGVFTETSKAENCESWVSYIVAVKR